MVTKEGLKEAALWIFRWFIAPALAALLIAGALLLSGFGKDIPIGGLLRRLFGKEAPKGLKQAEIASTVPSSRIDYAGNLIPVGQEDEKGFKQVPVVPIHPPDVFDDPGQVTFTTPEGKVETVELPKGVTSDQVEHVVVVTPSVVVVTVTSGSKVKSETIDSLLKKYAPES